MPDNNSSTFAGLILAAGSSSRMGRPKQLLPWKNTTLLGHTILHLRQVVKDVFVVLGANHSAIKSSIVDTNVHIIYNSSWETGMGTSIATAMATISNSDKYDAVLIALADQPLLESEYYQKMTANFRTKEYPIIATSYGKHCGVPAIFDPIFFPEMQVLHADYGAKKLIQKHKAQAKCLVTEYAELDIDTPESYEQLYKAWGMD